MDETNGMLKGPPEKGGSSMTLSISSCIDLDTPASPAYTSPDFLKYLGYSIIIQHGRLSVFSSWSNIGNYRSCRGWWSCGESRSHQPLGWKNGVYRVSLAASFKRDASLLHAQYVSGCVVAMRYWVGVSASQRAEGALLHVWTARADRESKQVVFVVL